MTEPDLPFDNLGDPITLDRRKGCKMAPKLAWGSEYKAWPLQQRLKHCEELAASQNQALDIMQQERNGLSDICRKKEEQLKSMAKRLQDATAMMNRELAKVNAERQLLLKQLYSDAALIKDLRTKLEEAGGDHD